MNNDKDIWKLALHIIGRHANSEYELRQKLSSKYYTSEEIDDVITRLLSYGYVNDLKLANNLFEKYLQVGKYSLNTMICKLKQHGIPDDMIKNLTNSYDSNEEMTSALKIVTSRFKSLDEIKKEKVYRFLATRGFRSSIIQGVVQQLYHDDI